MVTAYREPEEELAQDELQARVRTVLDQAVRDCAFCLVAQELDEPAEVVERWVNALWNRLRDNLRDARPAVAGMCMDDRLTAIVLLLEDRMHAEARDLLRELP
jgi:hypothetical protein